MVLSISALVEPVGSVKSWLRASNTVPLPTGWVICDGATIIDASSAFNTKPVPDLRSRFPRGHNSLTTANFGSDLNYYAGGTIPGGGTDSNNIAHSHGVSNHAHNFTATGGAHSHQISSSGPYGTNAGIDQDGAIGGVQFVYAGINGQHNHTFNIPTINTDFGASHNHFGTTDLSGTGTDTQLGSTENRPAFTELVLIIKIK